MRLAGACSSAVPPRPGARSSASSETSATRHLDEQASMGMYLPQSQVTDSFLVLTVKAATREPEHLLPAIRGILRELDPSVPVYDVARSRRAAGQVIRRSTLCHATAVGILAARAASRRGRAVRRRVVHGRAANARARLASRARRDVRRYPAADLCGWIRRPWPPVWPSGSAPRLPSLSFSRRCCSTFRRTIQLRSPPPW